MEQGLGLCNALATFKCCMISIFSHMIEQYIEVFMDDFFVFGSSCLTNLTKVLQRYMEKNLTLNWKKCHFMIKNEIILGHVISHDGIEVDK